MQCQGGWMSNKCDREYFAERAIVERRMSLAATDSNVAVIHELMAIEYEKRLADLRVARPKLTIAVRN